MTRTTVVETPTKAGAKTGTNYPPTPYLAAYQRMWREPHLLDAYEPGTWVAFSGENVVAAGSKLAEVIRAAEAAGEPDLLLVPIPPDTVLG